MVYIRHDSTLNFYEVGENKMGIELNNEQIYAVYDLEQWWHHSTNQLFQISGAAGTGKSEPVDTLIPTPNGEVRMGDLKVGDYVFNRHGQPVKILGVYDQGELEAYKVIFDDGRSTICNDEHLWSYYDYHSNILKTSTLKEIMKHDLVLKHRGHRFSIPNAKPVEYSTKDFSVDPYVIGAFIGNGCNTSKQLSFSSNDVETVETICKLIHAESFYKNPSSYTYTFVLNNDEKMKYVVDYNRATDCKFFQTDIFFEDYPELIGTSREKRIPNEYFYGDINQRWSLIQGLFDTDGCIKNNDRGSVSYSSVNLELLTDIKKILASLGCSSTIKKQLRIKDSRETIEYELYAKVDNKVKPNFFRLSRKKDIAVAISKTNNRHDYDKIKIYSIEDLGYKTPMRCIYVDDEEHLYLTNDYIVTHNTTLVRYLIERLELDYEEVLFVAFMGKAASQLSRNGLPAKTIHSAIYNYEKLVARDEEGKIIFKDNGKPKMVPTFVKKDRIGKKIKLIVVDEGSMVDEKTALDLMSYGIPIIVLGDLNQLPPVFGDSFFLRNPDIILRQIMRQSEGNPIIWLSQQVLAGNDLQYGVYGTSAVINKSDINEFHFRNSDIILTCTNRLRFNVNNYCREELKQLKRLDYPHIGEKVMCRKNNWNKSIDDGIYMTNGTTGFVEYIHRDSFNGKTMMMDFRPDFSKKSFKNVTFDYKHMYEMPGGNNGMDDKNFTSIFNDKMEFAYAITTHSSQGSQWPGVLFLVEDIMRNKEDQKRLLYTGITRASGYINIVR